MDAPSNDSTLFGNRSELYVKQRRFAISAARAYKATNKDAEDAKNILIDLPGYKCMLYSAKYAEFIHELDLERSLQSLKLFFLDLEAGLLEPVWPDDEDTVFSTLEKICFKQAEHTNRKRKQYTQQRRTQRCNKKIPILQTPPPSHHAPPHNYHHDTPAQLSTNMSLQSEMMRNVEALRHHCSTALTTEDYMKFIFGNKDIQQQFHRYINILMVNRQDRQKYVTLEREIGQRTLLMERIRTLPRPGQTFILPDFNNETFIAPCTKNEYVYKYCVDNYFRLPPSRETLRLPPRHPGLYTTTPMLGVKQLDPAFQGRDANIQLPTYRGRGTNITQKRPSSL